MFRFFFKVSLSSAVIGGSPRENLLFRNAFLPFFNLSFSLFYWWLQFLYFHVCVQRVWHSLFYEACGFFFFFLSSLPLFLIQRAGESLKIKLGIPCFCAVFLFSIYCI